MSIHPFPHRKLKAVAPVEPYFSNIPQPTPLLRPLTALDQMYAYWGSDRD